MIHGIVFPTLVPQIIYFIINYIDDIFILGKSVQLAWRHSREIYIYYVFFVFLLYPSAALSDMTDRLLFSLETINVQRHSICHKIKIAFKTVFSTIKYFG